ncbi:MAG: monofunctional biosynthetic peptidoglycan transglycosylase [Pseudomonadota bacterium]
MRYTQSFKQTLSSLRASRTFLGVPKRAWVRVLLWSPAALAIYVLSLIVFYSVINPPLSAFMSSHVLSGGTLKHTWVPMEKISRHLPIAVIVAEDAKYCSHNGVDWDAVRLVLSDLEEDRPPRGASTISMQTVKNLFLWSGRSYVRKSLEVPLAYITSLFWSKRRMMEIYLNIVEWGPGVYGAEAASRYHFGKTAVALNSHEAALLAAALPNPIGRRAGRPGPKTRRIGRVVKLRMHGASRFATCLR